MIWADSEEKQTIAPFLPSIEAAATMPHRQGTLLEHLVGVWRVIRVGGGADYLAKAGLIHSAYATEIYKIAMLTETDRPRLIAIFGEDAERLAWTFCKIDRKTLWRARPSDGFVAPVSVRNHQTNSAVELNATMANDLFALECANTIDQGFRGTNPRPLYTFAQSLSKTGVKLEFAQSIQALTGASELRAIEEYEAFLQTSQLDHALRAIKFNPLAAEPRILAAWICASGGHFGNATRLLKGADLRFARFGSSWDKRLSTARWILIGAYVTAAVSQKHALPRLPSVIVPPEIYKLVRSQKRAP